MFDSAKVSTIAHPFESAWRSLAHSRFLTVTLLALGTASNVLYAHTPLVAFAAMSGVTLTRRRALSVALLIWLVNQSIGFGLRGVSTDHNCFYLGGADGSWHAASGGVCQLAT